MDFNTYRSLAMVTCGQDELRNKLNMGAMGLCGEVGEVVDQLKKVLFHSHPLNPEKLVNEIGDALWYVSIISEAVGTEQYFPESEATLFSDIPVQCARLAGFSGDINFTVALAATLDYEYFLKFLLESRIRIESRLQKIMEILQWLSGLATTTLVEAAQINIAKLAKRYPEGFSSLRSINRED